MSLHETMTAVEHDIPVVALVFNNQQWGAEKRNQIDFYNDRFVGTNIGHDLGGFNFAEIARSMGADAMRISDPGDLGAAFRDAMRADKATVIEASLPQIRLYDVRGRGVVFDHADLTNARCDSAVLTQSSFREIDPEELAEPFRRDALQQPVRHLERYRHLSAREAVHA